jgi:hypothetical protein
MDEEQVKAAIEKVLKEHAICVDKDTAESSQINKEVIISERWISRRVLKEIKESNETEGKG